jgi:hypothetical protein
MVSITLILILVLIVAIWLIIEFKRFKHKILAIFLIGLVLFTYFSFSSVIKNENLDLKTASGVKEAGQLYVLWLGNAFKNVKVLTANAIHLDWSTTGEMETGPISNLTNETLNLSKS